MRSCLLLITLILSGAASASVLFQTSFEPPTYSVGTLNGQDQWFNASVPVVEAGTAFSGVQAVSYNAAIVSAQNLAFRPITYMSSASDSVLIARVWMMLSRDGTPSNWTALAVEGSTFLGNLVVLADGTVLVGNTGTFAPASRSVSRGVWNSFELDINFANQTIQGLVNGSLAGQLPFGYPANQASFTLLGVNSFPGTDTAFYDDLSIESVPEPASGFLAALGGNALIVLLLRGRRSKRRAHCGGA